MNDDILALKFEEALAALEQTAQSLESGELSLEDSMAVYERSVALANHCSNLLERAELRVRQLVEENDNSTQEPPF
ncbi:MAG: exodeoxyribonuclease VII small subunit [Chloroflexi bacterium]|nr:exodeoxyribonuclease VII small subunit [Chloroflexota bacterium]